MVSYLKLKEIDSTSDFAHRLLNMYSPYELNNTVIFAQYQTKGRGVGNNKWHSARGKNLTFSIIHCPDYLLIEQTFYLSKTISCAIVDFLESLGIDARIKWPNDIICYDSKCAGILIENTVSSVHKKIKSSVIGVGLNVNQTKFPEDLNAISIKLVTGRQYDLGYLLEKVVDKIFMWLETLKDRKFDVIDSFYFVHLYLFNKLTRFRSDDQEFEGKIQGVDQYGRLILEIPEQNSLKLFWQKEIEFLNV